MLRPKRKSRRQPEPETCWRQRQTQPETCWRSRRRSWRPFAGERRRPEPDRLLPRLNLHTEPAVELPLRPGTICITKLVQIWYLFSKIQWYYGRLLKGKLFVKCISIYDWVSLSGQGLETLNRVRSTVLIIGPWWSVMIWSRYRAVFHLIKGLSMAR